MQKLSLKQKNSQKLTPQQIQFIQMLQASTKDMQQRVFEELMENPALVREEESTPQEALETEETLSPPYVAKNYRQTPATSTFVQQQASYTPSVQEQIIHQLGFLPLSSKEQRIARYLIQSLTPEGYLSSGPDKIIAEIAVAYYEEVTPQEVENIRRQIQDTGPPGIAAYNLQEALLLKLAKKTQTKSIRYATVVVRDYFDLFTKKHYEKITGKLQLTPKEFQEILGEIRQLHRSNIHLGKTQTAEKILEPDFILTTKNNKLHLQLVTKYLPPLTINKQYFQMLRHHKGNASTQSKALVTFVQEKINRAKWFVRAIEQRKRTLLHIMDTMVQLQDKFFSSGSLYDLTPMFLRNVAEKINMDISTISRAIQGKYIQVHGEILPLSYFFSEAIPMQNGAVVSSHVVKALLKEVISKENKQAPCADQQLTNLLQEQGFLLARRTIAKYRQQLGYPVARMRKELQS